MAGARPGSADNASYFVWGSQDLGARFFSALGMTVPPDSDQSTGTACHVTSRAEEPGRLDTAALVVLVTAGQLPTPDVRQWAALSFSSVLSLSELLDAMPTELANVVAVTP